MTESKRNIPSSGQCVVKDYEGSCEVSYLFTIMQHTKVNYCWSTNQHTNNFSIYLKKKLTSICENKNFRNTIQNFIQNEQCMMKSEYMFIGIKVTSYNCKWITKNG